MGDIMNDEVSADLIVRGESLVAEGMDIAQRFGRWVEQVIAHQRTISASSGASSPALTVAESDAIGDLWGSLCRAPELHDVAEWMAAHARTVSGYRRGAEPAPLAELRELVGWTLGGHR